MQHFFEKEIEHKPIKYWTTFKHGFMNWNYIKYIINSSLNEN